MTLSYIVSQGHQQKECAIVTPNHRAYLYGTQKFRRELKCKLDQLKFFGYDVHEAN